MEKFDFDWELARDAALAAARELRTCGAIGRNYKIEAVCKALEDAATIEIMDDES